MADRIKILIGAEAGLDASVVESLLSVEPTIQILGLIEDLSDQWDDAARRSADLLVIACSGSSERALPFIERTVKERPDRPVVVVSDTSSNGFLRRIFEAGADDVVGGSSAMSNGALTHEVIFTVQKAMARRQGASMARQESHGALVCVLGPKGGIGKTLTATNLAAALVKRGSSAVVVDLDLQFGDVALTLGITPEKTAYDLATSSGTLDVERLDAYLATHESGVRALLAPLRPDHANVVTVDFLREVYPLLRATYDYVIVDTPPGFTPEVIATVDSATSVCMVGMLDSLSLKNTKLGLETLDLMGFDNDRIRLVLNRADSRVGITRNDVTEIVGRPPDVLVPSHRDIARSVNEGVPIVLKSHRSEAAKAFRTLASLYVSSQVPARTNGRRSLLGRRR
jgi:pilus assembly protein CpaE